MLYRIEYNKKPGKPSVVKVLKDPNVPRDDYYKSGAIHTAPGEPPNSRSKPTPRGKQVTGRPITKGKLLRPGGPGGGPSRLTSRPAAPRSVPQPMPSQPAPVQQRNIPSQPRPNPKSAVSQYKTPVQPLAAVNGINSSRDDSAGSATRAPPPPPPTAPPAVKKDTYRALYDFTGESEIELSVRKNEDIEVIKKEGNGKYGISGSTQT